MTRPLTLIEPECRWPLGERWAQKKSAADDAESQFLDQEPHASTRQACQGPGRTFSRATSSHRYLFDRHGRLVI
jgi:hypothetical protein